MNEIVMPKLSDTMTEGRIVSWKKRVGDVVRRGDVLAEVETDKANMELEAFSAGVLMEIKVQAGELAQVGTVIAVVGKEEEKGAKAGAAAPKQEEGTQAGAAAPKQEEVAPAGAAAPKQAEGAPGEPPRKEGAPPPEMKKERVEAPGQKEVPPETKPQQPPAKGEAGEPRLEEAMELGGFLAQEGGRAPEAKPPEATPGEERPGELPSERRERAAPVVRRRARELGLDLREIRGSGPEGRILLKDLEGREGAPKAGGQPAAGEAREEVVKPLSRLRAAVAKIVSESWSSIPHFSVSMEILMDEADLLRRQLKQSGIAVTLNDIVVKGAALALPKFPQLNASYTTGGTHLRSDINIGVAVGMPDGVLMPVIHGCQGLSLLEISQAGHALVKKARGGSLSEQEMSGGTFSVSNLGMYGVSEFTAIIYPSQGAVLAVGAVADAAVVRDGAPACAKVMKVTLSADHRLADGAYAAEYLVELKGILEHPLRLLL